MKPLKPLHPRRKTKAAAPPRQSHIRSHTYHHAGDGTGNLDVTFATGRTYRYSNVPVKLARGFSEAESRGTFLHKHLIGKHDATEIFPDRDSE